MRLTAQGIFWNMKNGLQSAELKSQMGRAISLTIKSEFIQSRTGIRSAELAACLACPPLSLPDCTKRRKKNGLRRKKSEKVGLFRLGKGWSGELFGPGPSGRAPSFAQSIWICRHKYMISRRLGLFSTFFTPFLSCKGVDFSWVATNPMENFSGPRDGKFAYCSGYADGIRNSTSHMSPSKPTRTTGKARWLLICLALFIVFCALAYPAAKQTLPVEMIRAAIKHVTPAQLWADDLADDVRSKRLLAHLQEWSVQTLARYRAGKLATVGDSRFDGPMAVRIAPQEIPNWLSGAWWGDSPEVSVLLNESKAPECIIVGWYLCGLQIGAPDYVTTWQPWYIVKVKPGVYAYSVEK
jgi:hypothetical protein